MKKIVLIEDRLDRQKQFLEEKEIIELNKIIVYIDIRITINQVNEKNSENLKDIDLIIFHRSAIDKKGLSFLTEFCNKNDTDLILFTGSISQVSFFTNISQVLLINSKDLYSSKLLPFLKNYEKNSSNLLELVYGDNWKLTYLLKLRHYTNVFNEENDEDTKDILENKINIIKGIISFDKNIDELDKVIELEISKI